MSESMVVPRSLHWVATTPTPFSLSGSHARSTERWKWTRVSWGRGRAPVLFPRRVRSSIELDLRSLDFRPELAHVGERRRWPRPAPWLVHGLPRGLDPFYGIWAFFIGPDGSGQYQLLSWVAFRLWAIFRLVISLSFISLFSLLGL
jgi:hypothetical protein